MNINMKTSTRPTMNCLFCDSARHETSKCKSNLKGKFGMLSDCMVDIECPEFRSFTLQELKVVAYLTPYTKSLYSGDGMNGNKLNRKYGRSPIPLTLSKNRMVKALQERWEGLRIVRERLRDKHTVELDDCPICLESIEDCSWHWKSSEWSKDYNSNTVKTICNHHFCGDCWNRIRPNYDDTKSCPLCRKHVGNADTLIHN